MNEQRDEAFEKWWGELARNYWTQIGYDIEADVHVSSVAEFAWDASQQAQRERDAQIAEQHKVEMPIGQCDKSCNAVCAVIAAAIREQV